MCFKPLNLRLVVGFGLACGFALTLLTSCTGGSSGNPAKLTSKYNQVFASADAPTKALWDQAVNAVKTNGYVVALQTLQALAEQSNLTTEQATATRETVTAVSDKMYDAANKGDTVAKESIEELRKLRSR